MGQHINQAMNVPGATNTAGTPKAYIQDFIDHVVKFTAIAVDGEYDIEASMDNVTYYKVVEGIDSAGEYEVTGVWKYLRIRTVTWTSGTGVAFYMGRDPSSDGSE